MRDSLRARGEAVLFGGSSRSSSGQSLLYLSSRSIPFPPANDRVEPLNGSDARLRHASCVAGVAPSLARIIETFGMKNVQVIDGAINCVYDIFAVTDAEFRLIFGLGEDVAFIDDVLKRHRRN